MSECKCDSLKSENADLKQAVERLIHDLCRVCEEKVEQRREFKRRIEELSGLLLWAEKNLPMAMVGPWPKWMDVCHLPLWARFKVFHICRSLGVTIQHPAYVSLDAGWIAKASEVESK